MIPDYSFLTYTKSSNLEVFNNRSPVELPASEKWKLCISPRGNLGCCKFNALTYCHEMYYYFS